MRELTQRKSAEAILRQNERLASLGTLSAGIAHQINNPIGAIMAGSEYALLCDDQPETWRETLLDNLESARRCARIVQGVLQFARDEPSEKSTEDLREIVRQSCRAMMGDVSSRYCELVLELPDRLCPVFVDPIQIQQILANMISNGIQSQPADARVVISMTTRGDDVCVDVRDRGRGIEEEVVKHLFDLFFTTRLEEGGTGLGLAISHGIAMDHNGSLEVSSKPGAGTVVSLTLPLQSI
jgi:two-component system NtrC family sensor kinase